MKVVAPLSGTVAAPPERVVWLKLPSGEVTVQVSTPCVFQNMETREPIGTLAGTAHISTFGSISRVVVGFGAGGFGLTLSVGFVSARTGAGVVCSRTGGAIVAGGGPT